MHKRLIPFVALFLALVVAGLATGKVLAHDRVEAGPYLIIIGWRSEPPIVGERNALLFEISKDGVPVEGVEGTMDVTVVYAGRTFTGNLSPTSTPGRYSVEIFPTVRGQYIVELGGTIEDLAIDATGEPEEVLPATVLQFPEASPDAMVMQELIEELTSQLQLARTLAIAGLAVGVLALVAALVVLVRSRR